MKIAVFIDFDNIEIGVKSTLNRHFDVGTVLEAIKERGEVVTKVAYGDWKRAGDHSRSMSQHAIQMVQRNLTPGGDKNGADINLALDALEMAFTRNHINAFVIVGGDSDFMALVEKLKQYDKKVMIVGGRSFTSIILQKNCHEFIAYENLISAPQASRRPAERTRTSGSGDASLAKAMPLVRRALKVLTDREVSPQLGLLKSTLLQLDSTFSERDYSASTFRDFIEKMASAGYVNLKQVDRSLLVELKEGETAPPPPETHGEVDTDRQPAFLAERPDAPPPPPSVSPSPSQLEEGVRALREVFQNARVTPHWPMYLRNVKQYVKNAAPAFDERRFGFVNFLEIVRAAQRAGVFRLERNRQGILRIFPGNQFPQQTPVSSGRPMEEEASAVLEAAPVVEEQIPVVEAEPIAEAAIERVLDQPIVENVEVDEVEEPSIPLEPEIAEKPARARRPRAAASPAARKKSPSRAPSRKPRKKPSESPEVPEE